MEKDKILCYINKSDLNKQHIPLHMIDVKPDKPTGPTNHMSGLSVWAALFGMMLPYWLGSRDNSDQIMMAIVFWIAALIIGPFINRHIDKKEKRQEEERKARQKAKRELAEAGQSN